jgi:hypothetical protein
MGRVYGGIPKEMARRIRDACQAELFIETGTYKGDTAAWAAGEFSQVVTVEIDPALHADAEKRFSGQEHVTCLLGDCRSALERILLSLAGKRALIWLDAHHCGQEDRDSPLLEEIELINRFLPDAAILIDDARFILAPIDGRRLCPLDGLVRALGSGGAGRDIVVLEDVVVTVPPEARPVLDAYCKEVSLAEWQKEQSLLQWKQTLRGRMIQKLERILKKPSGAGAGCR